MERRLTNLKRQYNAGWRQLERRLTNLKRQYNAGNGNLDDYWRAVSHSVWDVV